MIPPVSIKRTTRTQQNLYSNITTIVTGELLTMPDGSEWFHPYNGGKPAQVKA